jgi:flotillin
MTHHDILLGSFPNAGVLVAAGDELAAILVIASGLGVGLLMLLVVVLAKQFLHVCSPNEVLIFTGRKGGPLIIRPRGQRGDPGAGSGRKWRIPIIERVDRMDMRTMSIDVVVQNAYSAGNIPLQIHAIANVKIYSEAQYLRNAIERFLNQSTQEVQRVAQQTLEGALREVLAQMTPEQVNEDRLAFADNLIRSAKNDLDKLGLQLDTLKIQNVSDGTGYLDSLGRPAIAQALRDAENAENEALQVVTRSQATAHQRAEVAKAASETATLSKGNELAQIRAELDGEALAVEREAEVAAKTVRAQVEQALQKVRAQLEQKRLQAEVVIPAEFEQRAQSILARGDAAPTIENGKAVVDVLSTTIKAWKSMGPHAREIYVIQHLEEILATVVGNMRRVDVGEVTVLDPGDGSGLSSYAASYPQTIAAVLRALRETTGVDVPAIIGKSGERSSNGAVKPSPTGSGRMAPPVLSTPSDHRSA